MTKHSVADAVGFGEAFYFVEIVAEVEVLPAVGFNNGLVHMEMTVTTFHDTGNSFVDGV